MLYLIMSIQLEGLTVLKPVNHHVLNYSVSERRNKRDIPWDVLLSLAFANEHSQHLLLDDHHRPDDERAKHFEEMLLNAIHSSTNIQADRINLKSNSIDFIYIQLASIITSFYHRLNLPVRVYLSPSYELLSYESLRLTINVYFPSQVSYVRVGSISLIDDYLARRLMIKHGTSEKNYVAMVHACVADVSQLSKCILESSQTIGRGIKLPSVLLQN